MSLFNGKLKRRDKVRGNLHQQPPDLRATIEKIDSAPQATITKQNAITAAITRAGHHFSGAAHRLDLLYRFMSAKVAALVGLGSKASTGPAVEMEADRSTDAGKEAPLLVRPVEYMEIDQPTRLAVSVRLDAYNRAASTFVRSLAFSRFAHLIRGAGALAKYRKAPQPSRTSKAHKAEAAIAESRFSLIKAGVEAEAGTAPTKQTQTIRDISSETTAAAIPAQGAVSIAMLAPRLAHSVIMKTWIYTEQNGDTLTIRQAYSHRQVGTTLEIDTE